MSEMWRMNCAQVAGFDEAMMTKEHEIESLKAKIAELEASIGGRSMSPTVVPAAVVPAAVSPVHAIEYEEGKPLLLVNSVVTIPSAYLKIGYPLLIRLASGIRGLKTKR